jgi:hypothetical protein
MDTYAEYIHRFQPVSYPIKDGYLYSMGVRGSRRETNRMEANPREANRGTCAG